MSSRGSLNQGGLILRRVDRLDAGMQVRIKIWEYSRPVVRTVHRRDPVISDPHYITITLFKLPTDKFTHDLSFRLFVDDLVEVVL